jgi:hypothetical protein
MARDVEDSGVARHRLERSPTSTSGASPLQIVVPDTDEIVEMVRQACDSSLPFFESHGRA